MSSSLDLTDDLAAIVDGLEVVTLHPSGSGGATTVTRALRRALTELEQAASQGRYLAGDVTWHLPASEVAAAPRPGTALVDAAGTRFTILSVDEASLGSRWRCVSRRLSL